jgi:hypothetical protein
MADLLTASSPKFNEKKKIPAAEEKAYNNIAPCIRRWATLKVETRAVTPARKKDKAKRDHGMINTQTLGADLNSHHQKKVPPRKMPPML